MRPSVALRGGRLSKGAAPRTAECCLDRGPRFPKGFRGIIRSHDTLEGGSCAGVRRSAHKREVRRACMGADTQPSIVPHQIGAYKTGRRVAHGARTCRSSRRQLQHRPQGVSRLGGRRSHLLQPRKAIVRGRCRQQETGASRVSGRSGHRGWRKRPASRRRTCFCVWKHASSRWDDELRLGGSDDRLQGGAAPVQGRHWSGELLANGRMERTWARTRANPKMKN